MNKVTNQITIAQLSANDLCVDTFSCIPGFSAQEGSLCLSIIQEPDTQGDA